jgi:hypothetical protein
MLSFETRVRIHKALDVFSSEADESLDLVRGLGIQNKAVTTIAGMTAVAAMASRLLMRRITPHDGVLSVGNRTLIRLAHAVFQPPRCGWNRCGDTWAWFDGRPEGDVLPSTEGQISIFGGDATLWECVRREFTRSIPYAVMAETGNDALNVVADRAVNVRPLTSSERPIAERVHRYINTGTPLGMLLYGPQGSAKTTLACSLAAECTGSYFRLSAMFLGRDVTNALVSLRPSAVIIDDIDRVDDAMMLETLDALSAANVLVICTSNTAPDNRHGEGAEELMDAALVRSGRLDIHIHVSGLDPDSHADICRAVKLTADLGPRGSELLASDLVCLGRRQRAGDLPEPHAAVEDLLQRRTNTVHRLRSRTLSATKVVSSGA